MKKYKNIFLITLIVFVIRLIFSFLPSFDIDMGAWLGWAKRMAEVGPASFYTDEIWTQYTPLFLYWLWLGGETGWVNELFIKSPTIIADILTGLLVWKLISKKDIKLANLSFLFYVLNPVVIFNSSIWGQIDGILSLLMLLSSYFLVDKDRLTLSIPLLALAFLLKPQAAVLALPLLFIAIRKKLPLKDYLVGGVLGLTTIFAVSLPFFPENSLFGIFNLVSEMTGFYSFTSLFAFNFWSLVGMWIPDSQKFLGISYFALGVFLYIASVAILLYKFRNKVKKPAGAYLLIAGAIFASFLFPTRVHERYLLPMFAPLLLAAGLKKSKILYGLYFLLSLLNLINLYHPYAYYTENFLKSEMLLNLTGDLAPIVGLISLILFFAIVFWEKIRNYESKISFSLSKKLKRRRKKLSFPKVNVKKKYLKAFLVLVIAFSFFSRLAWLNNPSKEYFDEVYHAFTARQILHGQQEPWEWWNTPPEGFAYEWTHPPFAKLAMVGGMFVFGENPFGWRIPGVILGAISVFLIYLIAKEMFKDEVLAILSAGAFSLDGLPFVMSRIGMNDIYLLTFSLLSLYLFLKDKNLLSALSFGLAISSKWSAVWLIPVLFVSHFVFKKKFRFSYVWFLLIPPAVYLATYIPMFVTGHGFETFIGMQKQMWWYHTGLVAEHSYTSSWWSWPLMFRPIWLYTGGEGGFVSNIYAMGNPAVFWFGFLSVILSAWYAFKQKSKKLGFLVFSYLIFFVPWALSPRIMFLYHYLPSVPFLAIATGFILRKKTDLVIPFGLVTLLLFIYFFPHMTGLSVPRWLDLSYYWFPSWR